MFIRSLALADHLGDVANDVDWVLKMMGVDAGSWGNLDELGEKLGDMGVKYMHELGDYNLIHVTDELTPQAYCSVCRIFHEHGHGGLSGE